LGLILLVSKQVFHHAVRMTTRIAEGKPGNGPDMLLELRDCTGRFRPMPGIVHPWSDLVDEQRPVFQHEELDPDHTYITKCIQDAAGYNLRSLHRVAGHLRRHG